MKYRQKKELLKKLETLEDFRTHTGKIIYPLSEVLFMALFGLLKGKVTFESLHDWMELNATNSILLKLFNKEESIAIPSESTLHRILVNVDNDEFEKIFRDYFKRFASKKHIAIDGKWLNGSDVNGQYTEEKHKSILNILDKEKKIVIGHRLIGDDKKSEIPAFKEELENNELFCDEGQIFSFDALMTQSDILNKINSSKNYYIAKLKGNQKNLKAKAIQTAETFVCATSSHEETDYKIEGNKYVERKVEVFQSSGSNIVMFDSNFHNIQSIIKVTKKTTDLKTNKVKQTEQFLIANFQTDSLEFSKMILQHWRVETYHYHLDMLTKEDSHIAYINPFSIAILRSFAINLYQLFFNEHDGEKIIVDGVQTKKPLTMARTKRYCENSDQFTLDLLEPL